MKDKAHIAYRKAFISDAKVIQKLIQEFAAKDEMLPRSLNQIYERLRDFWVCEVDHKVRACCALHITWEDLAEICSVAVSSECQGKGIGKELVRLALEEARQLKIPKAFLLTYKPEFFGKLGFTEVDKNTLPKKVWAECVNCPKFPDCGEIAMVQDL
ncbi:N-acetyltransferase [Candidatus Sumerlaeota bacterium]|nr:N-acetyltransferase [Candidatus Sumerlaeota bacterium]